MFIAKESMVTWLNSRHRKPPSCSIASPSSAGTFYSFAPLVMFSREVNTLRLLG